MRKQKTLLSILLLFPLYCFGDTEHMLGAVINIFLICVYSLTAIAIYLFIKFYYSRNNINKTLSLIISIFLVFVAVFILLTSGPSSHYTPSESDIQFYKNQLLVGYTILIPNLTIVLLAPFIKSYPQLEALLGRISEDKDIIIWVSIKRITTGQIEISYYKVLDRLRKFSRNFYSLLNLGIWEVGGKKQFDSFQGAVDFLRDTHHGLNIVNKGQLQTQYLKMLNSESH